MIDLQSLSALLDDEGLVRKYLLRFTDDMPELIRQMWSAYEAGNWNEVSLHAHTYKTQLQYIGETTAMDLAMQLEKSSSVELPDPAEIEQLIRKLDEQLDITLDEIRQISG